MTITLRILAIVLIAGCCLGILPAAGAQAPIGGNQAWYAVHCNVDGASVFFDDQYKGETQGGVLYVAVFTTGTPYSMYSVQKDGYATYSAPVHGVPGMGETFDLYATLNPTQPTQPPVIGGDIGWYTVHCNVDGASVMFDNTQKGVITNGILTVQVYTTGTPYSTYTVTMNGYLPFTAPITSYPAKGETVDLYATLNPAPTPTPAGSPVSLVMAFSALVAVGLLFLWRKD